jgi:hypothetical protein
MKDIARGSSQSQFDFALSPLGRWAETDRDDAFLTPGGQRRAGLSVRFANLLAELNGLGPSR